MLTGKVFTQGSIPPVVYNIVCTVTWYGLQVTPFHYCDMLIRIRKTYNDKTGRITHT